MTARKPTKRAGVVLPAAKPIALISDVRDLILQARKGVARAVDSGLTTLYWHVGRRVRQDILKEKRAEYGEEIVAALARQLGWLKRYAYEPGDAQPLGMILCAGKSEEHIALLELQKSGIHVASYWTDALPKKKLERKLHEAVRLARARLEAAKD